MAKKFYVLGVSKSDPEDVWVLGLESGTVEDCQRKVNWQAQPRGAEYEHPDTVWHICWYNPERRDFVSLSNDRPYVPYRAIYTHDAWEDFITEIGGIVCRTPVMERWNDKGDLIVEKRPSGQYGWTRLNEHGNKDGETRSFVTLNACIYDLQDKIGEER